MYKDLRIKNELLGEKGSRLRDCAFYALHLQLCKAYFHHQNHLKFDFNPSNLDFNIEIL